MRILLQSTLFAMYSSGVGANNVTIGSVEVEAPLY